MNNIYMRQLNTLVWICVLCVLCVFANLGKGVNFQALDDQIVYIPFYGNLTDANPRMYSGYLPIGKGNSSLFYWFVESENNPETDPLVLWLNGGPGCSSMTGFLSENGYFKFVDVGNPADLTLKVNPYSWTKNASVIWIDQPIGTGLSFADDVDLQDNETVMAESLYNALVYFLTEVHPSFSDNPFFASGESYAGKYIPRLAEWILDANKGNVSLKINLQGILIGNALVDPFIQRTLAIEQAYGNGLISLEQADQLYSIKDKCHSAIAQGDILTANDVCDRMLEFINLAVGGGLDLYDIRKYGPSSSAQREKFLNTPAVREALHIPYDAESYEFKGCSEAVYEKLSLWRMISVANLIPKLATDIRVLLYNGNFDLKDGPIGTEKYLANLDIEGWNTTLRAIWRVDDAVAGYVKSVGNLTFLTVFGAGHFVPTDQPKNSLAMLNSFLSNQPFCDSNNTDSHEESTKCAYVTELCQLLNNCSYPAGVCTSYGQCECADGYGGADCSIKIFDGAVPMTSRQIEIVPYQWSVIKLNVESFTTVNIYFTSNFTRNPYTTLYMVISKDTYPSLQNFTHIASLPTTTYSFRAALESGTYYLGLFYQSDPSYPASLISGALAIDSVSILEGSQGLVIVIILAVIAAIGIASTIVLCIKINCAPHKEAFEVVN